MAAIISIQTREEFIPSVIDGKAKVTKAGNVKRVSNNRVVGRSTKVDPLMEKSMVRDILEKIQWHIDNTTRDDYQWQWERNRLYFILAINLKLRVSDMVGARKDTLVDTPNGKVYPSWTGLKWTDLFTNGKINDTVTIKELKTGHMQEIVLDRFSKEAIERYIEKYPVDTAKADYVFLNRRKQRLSHQTIYNFIKDITKECGFDGNYGTHSFRKTGIYHLFMDTVDEEGVQWAMVDTMNITGHRTETALLHYLGLDKRQKEDKNQRRETYWEGIM